MKFAQFNAAGALIARYDTAVHGRRIIEVPDPSWVRPTVLVVVDGAEVAVPDNTVAPARITIQNPGCTIPLDAVEVSDELFFRTINETDGVWLRDPTTGDIAKHPFPPPTDAGLAIVARAERDARIAAVAWRHERHAREARLGLIATDNIADLDIYVQALADLPQQAGFPATIAWPVAP